MKRFFVYILQVIFITCKVVKPSIKMNSRSTINHPFINNCRWTKQKRQEERATEKSFTSVIAQINQVCDTLDVDIQQIDKRLSSLREKVDTLEEDNHEPLSVIVPPPIAKKRLCNVCGGQCKKRCKYCKTYYCGLEHQNQDWKEHKKVCKKEIFHINFLR